MLLNIVVIILHNQKRAFYKVLLLFIYLLNRTIFSLLNLLLSLIKALLIGWCLSQSIWLARDLEQITWESRWKYPVFIIDLKIFISAANRISTIFDSHLYSFSLRLLLWFILLKQLRIISTAIFSIFCSLYFFFLSTLLFSQSFKVRKVLFNLRNLLGV